jgi:flagellar biosynthetic protein FliP
VRIQLKKQGTSSMGARTATLSLATLGLGILAAEPAAAQSLSLDLGHDGTVSGTTIQLIALISVLSLAPGLLVMATAFTRITVILSLLRTATGLQQTPPNPVLVSLSLFLTFFVMADTFEKAWTEGVKPLTDGIISEEQAAERTIEPFRQFMEAHVRDSDLRMFLEFGGQAEGLKEGERAPLKSLVPAFMISELYKAFQIGFLLFLPFLIIDMVIAAVLNSMGMMMLSPPVISLPFKLIFFVMVDGWSLLVGSIVRGFGP